MIWVALAVSILGIAWLAGGRHLTLLLDRWMTVGAAPLPVGPLSYDGGGLVIAGQSLTFGGVDNLRIPIVLSADSINRVLFTFMEDSFCLGPRTNPIDPSGRPEIQWNAEPGDQISLTSSRSSLSWPTPFEYRILGGASPWWRRFAYYQLHWQKISGAELDILWRYEQKWMAASGWSTPAMLWNDQTGLISINIRPGLERDVVDYVARTKRWERQQYQIEARRSTADGRSQVFQVIHHDDAKAGEPGSGKSFELQIDRTTRRVVKELGAQ